MTILLKDVFKKASQLSDDAQKLLAYQLLDDIEAELRWDDTLSKSQDNLEKMAEKARRDFKSGKVHQKGFDEL
ncbi:MAG: hypothetical protein JXB48_07260 [Candidatus Latescibacteria bacterium]|nr:hypothetical protein [Candidatus Latescibacterota bacterium]